MAEGITWELFWWNHKEGIQNLLEGRGVMLENGTIIGNRYEIIGKNGNRIFLPASGWIQSSEVEYRNQYGYYWTSERSSSSQFARSLQFPKKGKGIVGNGYLHVGRSIRAVCK